METVAKERGALNMNWNYCMSAAPLNTDLLLAYETSVWGMPCGEVAFGRMTSDGIEAPCDRYGECQHPYAWCLMPEAPPLEADHDL